MKLQSAVPIALGSLILLMSAAMSGCSLDEILTVDVSKQTRDHYQDLGLDVPSQITLREARDLQDERDDLLEDKLSSIVDKHRRANGPLDRAVADRAKVEQLVGMAVNDGITAGIPALAGIPGGGIAATLLVGLGAWFAPRPGEKKKVAEAESKVKAAEDKGRDMGRSEAIQTITSIKPN